MADLLDYEYIPFRKVDSGFIDSGYHLTNEIRNLPSFLAFVAVLGFLTNGALVFVLVKSKVRKVVNTLILNLAVGDLLFSLFFLPVNAFVFARRSYPFGDFVCKITQSFGETCLGVSAFTLTALSVHALLITSTTSTSPKGLTERKAVVVVAATWILAIICSLPVMLMVHVRHYNGNDAFVLFCEPVDFELAKFELSACFVVHVVIPLAAVASFYCVARRNRTAGAQNRSHDELLNVVLVLASVYAICLVPCYLVDLWLTFSISGTSEVRHGLDIAAFCLAVVHRCINPLALCFASGTFRKLFGRHLLCWCNPRFSEEVDDLEIPLQEALVQDSPTFSSTRPQVVVGEQKYVGNGHARFS